jgi:hypothetical protein
MSVGARVASIGLAPLLERGLARAGIIVTMIAWCVLTQTFERSPIERPHAASSLRVKVPSG